MIDAVVQNGMKTFQFSEGCVKACVFQTEEGCQETSLVISPNKNLFSFKQQLKEIEGFYLHALESLNLSLDTAIFRRIFVSDITNQSNVLSKSFLYTDNKNTAVSVVQQPPLLSTKVILHAYHMSTPDGNPLQKKKVSFSNGGPHSNAVLVRQNRYGFLWTVNQAFESSNDNETVTNQTNKIFKSLRDLLRKNNATLESNTIRTWIYVRDIDQNYDQMVRKRKEIFTEEGMTEDTHYIASTGIEGRPLLKDSHISMDALSIFGIQKEQIEYINAFEYLNSTSDYGVTFERATKVLFGDRNHYYISGTASIDKKGDVLYPEDVIGQAERTLENIEALLKSAGASLDNMFFMNVYLRDPSDSLLVRSFLNQQSINIPYTIVHGSVCRPEWLIEIDGIAISTCENHGFEPLK